MLIELSVAVCLGSSRCLSLKGETLYPNLGACDRAAKAILEQHAAELERLGYLIIGYTCRRVDE